MSRATFSVNDYHVGWVSALNLEFVIARELLDEEYPHRPHIPTDDKNSYAFGRIGEHHVVLVCLPKGRCGLTEAAAAATHMLRSFPAIQFWLMVGIGGGAPGKNNDIRLGDVVVSTPVSRHGGVIRYDRGKTIQDKVFERTSSLNVPPDVLLNAVPELEQRHIRKGHGIDTTVHDTTQSNMRLRRKYSKPPPGNDILFSSSFTHTDDSKTCAQLCAIHTDYVVARPERAESVDQLEVHYGLIASGDQVMKDALLRDYLVTTEGVLCFETEAAGLMNQNPCIVIRGISDYCDTHKNDIWQGYAAAVAAVYAKQLLSVIPTRSRSTSEPAFRSHDVNIAEDHVPSSLKTDGPLLLSTYELACLRSLWFSDMDDRRSNIDPATEGTCLWLANHPRFQQWKKQGNGILWIKGKPGAGKSVLLDTMLRTIEDEKMKDRTTVASFFVHGRGSPMQKSVTGLYRSLLHQILGQIRPLLTDFRKIYEKNTELKGEVGKTWNWHEKELFRYLSTAVKDYSRTSRVIVFVDALDEFGEVIAKQVADQLWQLTSGSNETGLGLSVCFACRHFPNVALHNGIEIYVEDENTNDIGSYVNKALTEAFPSSPQLQALEDDIIARASGLFLWVVLIVPEIVQLGRDGYSVDTASSRVKTTPKDLELLFEGLLLKIRAFDRPRSLRLIQWVCLAQWPLSILELQYVLSFDEHKSQRSLDEWTKSEYYPKDIDQTERQLRALSGGLLEIQGQKRRSIQFIHQSVKDYFMDSGMLNLEQSLPQSVKTVTPSSILGRAHDSMCKCCLQYMFTDEIRNTSTVLPRLLQLQYPLLEYAASNWHLHAKSAETLGISQASLMDNFGWPSQDLLHHLNRLFSNSLKPDSSVLHVASVFGLVSLARAVIVRIDKSVLNIKDLGGCTPLLLAAKHRHTEVAEVLLNSGADLAIPDKDGRVPLHFAALYENLRLMSMLLDRGADLNRQDNDGWTALMIAADRGLTKSVELLLEKGADPNKVSINKYGALYWAALRGHLVVANMLIRKGANTNIRVMSLPFSKYRESPQWWNENEYAGAMQEMPTDPQFRSQILFEAVKAGQIFVIYNLLQTGMDVNMVNGAGITPMQAALNCFQLKSVQYLIQAGAKTDAVYPTLIDEAVRKGFVPLTRFLLDKFGAVILSRTGFTPIFVAINAENEGMVELLISKGTNLEQRSDRGSLPLLTAAYRGHRRIVEILLQEGANVLSADQQARTSLFYATQNNDAEMVKRLLEAGADPNTIDVKSVTPLLNAVRNRSSDIVHLLLTNDLAAETELEDSQSRTTLSWAAQIGHNETVEALIEHGAVLESQDADGLSPLCWAVKCGHTHIVELLLDKGANLETTDRQGNSPLNLAIVERNLHIAKILMQKGANLYAVNGAGQTPVEHAMTVGFAGFIELLLSKSSPYKVIDLDTGLLLVWAAKTGQANLVRLLIQRLNTMGIDQIHITTAFFEAVYRRQSDIVDILLTSKTAQGDCRDSRGRTALWHAITKSDFELTGVLLQHGVNLQHRDHLQRTPLSYACQFGNQLVVEASLHEPTDICNQPDPKGRTPLWWATDSNHIEVMKSLLTIGNADPNVLTKSGDNALQRAVKKNYPSAVQLLLQHGAMCNLDVAIESTPLALAVDNNNPTIVLLLLQHGAMFDYILPSGQTVLCWAAKKGYLEIVRALLDRGADPDFAAPHDQTPQYWAWEGGHREVVRLLIEYAMK